MGIELRVPVVVSGCAGPLEVGAAAVAGTLFPAHPYTIGTYVEQRTRCALLNEWLGLPCLVAVLARCEPRAGGKRGM